MTSLCIINPVAIAKDDRLPNVILEDAHDGLLLDTLHVYVPETVTVRV